MKRIAQNIAAFILCGWGLFSLMYIAGDPIDPMSDTEFIIRKLFGVISLAVSVMMGATLDRHGWLPDDKKKA